MRRKHCYKKIASIAAGVCLIGAIALTCSFLTKPSPEAKKQPVVEMVNREEQHDLVYRDYGADVIKADAHTVFTIGDIGSLLGEYREIEGIYAINHDSKQIYRIPISESAIEYQVIEEGNYDVYAVTLDGDYIYLNRYIMQGVTYSVADDSNGFMQLE
ncbi:hypothetical protein [Konateibacter massiliensis]|uniref:hypothetical protein n=1 Tax=Konateibacter massiliensis TaxID=2002841 RepID=UPI000C156A43|nr:hypothetical protein [Konateibacter massiliensis]